MGESLMVEAGRGNVAAPPCQGVWRADFLSQRRGDAEGFSLTAATEGFGNMNRNPFGGGLEPSSANSLMPWHHAARFTPFPKGIRAVINPPRPLDRQTVG